MKQRKLRVLRGVENGSLVMRGGTLNHYRMIPTYARILPLKYYWGARLKSIKV